jgi:hypothetical protein
MFNSLKLKQGAVAVIPLMSILGSLAVSLPVLAQDTTTPELPKPEVQVTPSDNGANNQIDQTQQNPPGGQLPVGDTEVTTEAPPPVAPRAQPPQPPVVETNKPVIGLW